MRTNITLSIDTKFYNIIQNLKKNSNFKPSQFLTIQLIKGLKQQDLINTLIQEKQQELQQLKKIQSQIQTIQTQQQAHNTTLTYKEWLEKYSKTLGTPTLTEWEKKYKNGNI